MRPPARLTAREAEVIEANAVARGASLDDLMEAAGRAVAEEAVRRLPPPPAGVAVLAGSGNNGGDGFVAAQRLAALGYRPEVWRLHPTHQLPPGPARRAYRRLRGRVPVHTGVPPAERLARFPLAIDAMLGTGQTGALRTPYLEATHALARSGVPVLSVDVPTGLGAVVAVRPRATVTFTAPKAPMNRRNSGTIIVRDIGIPAEAIGETGPGEYLSYPFVSPAARDVRIVVLGGGPYAGAPALTALAALRAGAERATVICPASVLHDVRAVSPTVVAEPVGTDRFRARDAPELLRRLRSFRLDAVALGMGTGRDRSTVDCLSAVLRGLPPHLPVVVDADGLEAALALPERQPRPGLVLTPNQGELLRILGERSPRPTADRTAAFRGLLGSRGFTLLAKGDPDCITDGHRTASNRHHDPAGMVSGAGDVLDGVLATLLGGGVAPFPAARLAAYWVGDAGLRLARRLGYGLIASDLIGELPSARLEGKPRAITAGLSPPGPERPGRRPGQSRPRP